MLDALLIFFNLYISLVLSFFVPHVYGCLNSSFCGNSYGWILAQIDDGWIIWTFHLFPEKIGWRRNCLLCPYVIIHSFFQKSSNQWLRLSYQFEFYSLTHLNKVYWLICLTSYMLFFCMSMGTENHLMYMPPVFSPSLLINSFYDGKEFGINFLMYNTIIIEFLTFQLCYILPITRARLDIFALLETCLLSFLYGLCLQKRLDPPLIGIDMFIKTLVIKHYRC